MADFEANFEALLRGLTAVEQRQVPYALALTLNAVVTDVKTNTEGSMTRRLDKPIPFTQKGLAIHRATKARLEASAFFKDRQAAYLELQESGGMRRPKGRALVLPADQKVNRYGNLPKGTVKRLLLRGDVFSGSVGGVAGIWQRFGPGKRKLRLLIAYEPEASYRPRLKFQDSAYKTARARIETHFNRSMAFALRTAKR